MRALTDLFFLLVFLSTLKQLAHSISLLHHYFSLELILLNFRRKMPHLLFFFPLLLLYVSAACNIPFLSQLYVATRKNLLLGCVMQKAIQSIINGAKQSDSQVTFVLQKIKWTLWKTMMRMWENKGKGKNVGRILLVLHVCWNGDFQQYATRPFLSIYHFPHPSLWSMHVCIFFIQWIRNMGIRWLGLHSSYGNLFV